ncbi:hypothetical protein HHI36_018230 [Cryptolaemus montrouzieri]|uniref:Uncharacterized protein n=1 Tax=Cryptolaemus montrouzieri TaxID=559131 RepID=A0ABD2NZA8_9CUCU
MGIFHAACLKRTKGWEMIDAHKVICSQKCNNDMQNDDNINNDPKNNEEEVEGNALYLAKEVASTENQRSPSLLQEGDKLLGWVNRAVEVQDSVQSTNANVKKEMTFGSQNLRSLVEQMMS